MSKKRIGLCSLKEDDCRTMAHFCEDAIFAENVSAKIIAQGSEDGLTADVIMSDHIYAHWSVKLLHILDHDPILWALILEEGDYWERRFQSLDKNLRGEV